MKHIVLLLIPALLLAACGDDEQAAFQGYAEGEYVRVAPVESGLISEIAVKRGDRVSAGSLLFRLDSASETAGRERAAADLAQAKSRYEDLTKGLRETELEEIRASRENAAAALRKTKFDLDRADKLYKIDAVSRADLDAAKAAHDQAEANLRQFEARLATGKLAARQDQIDAAQAAVKSAEAALAEADWKLARREGRAPQDAMVEDTYFRPGELAGPNQPVVSLLPAANIKLRFFIPEPQLGGVHVGDKVALTCDSCPTDLKATVRFIASQAEFTPPVIYSEQSQAKLVYMAEAWPDANPESLHPGQPVRVVHEAANREAAK